MMDIACCTDKNYAKYCLAMLLSLLDHNRTEKVTIHVLTNHISEEDAQIFHKTIEKEGGIVYLYPIDGSLFDGFQLCKEDYISPTTYARLFLSTILPSSLNKVIYLDCDILVTNNLSNLWKTDINERPLAAVEDACSGNVDLYSRLKIDRAIPYFNAGVLLLNLKFWRENECERAALAYLRDNNKTLRYADQDVLNALFHEQVLLLPLRYNMQESFFREVNIWERHGVSQLLTSELASPCIVHFTYKHKPWSYYCFLPYRKPFHFYFKKTPYRRFWPKITMKGLFYRLIYQMAIFFHLVNRYRQIQVKCG